MQNRHFQMQELKLTCKASHFKTIITYSKQLNIRTIGALANSKLESSGGESRNRKLLRIQNANNALSFNSVHLNFNLIILLVFNFLYPIVHANICIF